MQAYYYDGEKGETVRTEEIPAANLEEAEKYREAARQRLRGEGKTKQETSM